MDLMLRRRELLRMGGGQSGYIKNGLVFHLDGINTGTTDTSKWVDLVGGIVFAEAGGTSVHNTDNIHVLTTQRLVGDKIPETLSATCTIEIAATLPNNNWIFIFATNRSYTSCYLNGDRCICNGTNGSYKSNTRYAAGTVLASMANNDFVVNGVNESVVQNTFNNIINTVPVINSLQSGSQSYSKEFTIYNIRIYNRLLTHSEMLQNQKIDNERFNLGLTLPDTIS